jgi:hypothetical protein
MYGHCPVGVSHLRQALVDCGCAVLLGSLSLYIFWLVGTALHVAATLTSGHHPHLLLLLLLLLVRSHSSTLYPLLPRSSPTSER